MKSLATHFEKRGDALIADGIMKMLPMLLHSDSSTRKTLQQWFQGKNFCLNVIMAEPVEDILSLMVVAEPQPLKPSRRERVRVIDKSLNSAVGNLLELELDVTGEEPKSRSARDARKGGGQ